MKKQSLAVALTLGMAGLTALNSCGNKVPQSAEAKTEAAITIQSAKVSMAPMASTLKVTGSLEGIREATVASETQGRVLTVAHTTGDRVGAGTAIVKVDDELKVIAVEQAVAGKLAAETALDKAKLDYERNTQLLKDNAVTKNQLELAQLQVRSAEASLKSAETAESLARRQAADATVKAPFGGVITMRYVNQGEMLAPGAKVATLVDDSRMKFRMSIGEMDVVTLKTGSKVALTVDALPGQTFTGTITSISAKADMARSYAVEVELQNNGSLKSGMFARAEIQRESIHDVPVVPNDAIINNGTKTQVYVVSNGVANLRAVKVGATTPDKVEVADGLKSDEEVVTFGQNLLHDGAKVRVAPTEGK